MEEGELIKEFLGDMPMVRFIALYVFALAGMIMYFAMDIVKAVKTDVKTPRKFSWSTLFKRGLPRIVANLIFLAVVVIFYGELSMVLFNSEVPLVLDGLSAIIMGTQSDVNVNKFVGLARNGK